MAEKLAEPYMTEFFCHLCYPSIKFETFDDLKYHMRNKRHHRYAQRKEQQSKPYGWH